MENRKLPYEIHIETKEAAKQKVETKDGETKKGFEAEEHRDIGNMAYYTFRKELNDNPDENLAIIKVLNSFVIPGNEMSELYDPQTGGRIFTNIPKVELKNGIKLTFGEIVALAGDFLGTEEPIGFGGDDLNDCIRRFEAAYAKLEINDEGKDKIEKVLKHIKRDSLASSPHAHWSLKLVKAFKDASDVGNAQYVVEASGDFEFWHSPYLRLAVRNFDHFGPDAIKAYSTGHHIAIEMARRAGEEKDPAEKLRLLRGAFLREFFACHFLTDLFAGGHARTPRREILNHLIGNNDISGIPENFNEISEANLIIAASLARKMHDEDGENGIYVTNNQREKPWKAFGDGNYYKKENNINAEMAFMSVKAALKDLQLAFQGKPLSFALNDHLPRAQTKDENKHQKLPLFYAENNELHCRGEISKTVKKDGIMQGGMEALGSAPTNLTTMACRFFNVSVKETKDGISRALNEEEIMDLKERIEGLSTRCNIQ